MGNENLLAYYIQEIDKDSNVHAYHMKMKKVPEDRESKICRYPRSFDSMKPKNQF